MTSNPIDIAVIILYLGGMIWLGYYSMKQTKSFDDYAVAGRCIPAALLFATVAATLCGGGATIGRVAYIHKQGLIVFVGLLGVILNQFISGYYIAPRVREAGKNIYSIGDLFGLYYGRAGRLVSSILAFFFCVGGFGVQVVAMGRILQTVTGIDLIPAALVATVFTLVYTWAGGYIAVVLTDAVQFVVIALSISFTAVLGIQACGGLENAMQAVASRGPESVMLLEFFRSDWSTAAIVALFISFMLGEMCAPTYIQRYASASSVKDSKRGVLTFAFYYVFFLATTGAIGVCSLYLQPDVTPDLALTTMIQKLLPVGISGIALAGLLAAVMSSSDSFINSAAVIFTRDLYQEYINPKASQTKLLVLTKTTTLVVGVLGIFCAILVPDVFTLMLVLFNFWGPAILPPLLVGLLWGKVFERKISPFVGVPAMLAGLIITQSWPLLGAPLGIPANLAGLAASFVTMFIVHQVFKGRDATGAFAPEMLEKTETEAAA